jgi:hypothetical protein
MINEYAAVGEMRNEIEVFGENSPHAIFPSRNPVNLTWDRTRISVVGTRRLTARQVTKYGKKTIKKEGLKEEERTRERKKRRREKRKEEGLEELEKGWRRERRI